jgi:outer membrane protein assembly factor BamB
MQRSIAWKTLLLATILFVSSVLFACGNPEPTPETATLPAETAEPASDVVEEVILAVDDHGNLSEVSPAAPSTTEITPAPAPTLAPTPEPTPSPVPTEPPVPHSVTGTAPEDFKYVTELAVGDNDVSEYMRETPILFGRGGDYAALPGVLTLRGSNYRENAAYGTVPELTGNFKSLWSVSTGSLNKSSSGAWTGSGWTGQCLMVQWPAETRKIMNLYAEFKEKDGWVEVIYATMDGNVYFLDLETGKPTREKLKIGIPFKGAGALDPRGIPVLYLGTGDTYSEKAKRGRAMAYSLIDFTRLWEVGIAKDSFALRNWTAYDSSVLVDAAADTALIPGENGIFYTLKMNTVYDEAAGRLTMSPDPVVKQRYDSPRLGPDRDNKYFYGYESSAATWRNYAYLCDNGGYMRCIDLNTMKTVWVQDLLDDMNSTPALEEGANGVYLYVGNTVDRTMKRQKGTAAFFKVNAVTGEIVWKYDYEVNTTEHITGGCMSSAVLGKDSLEGLVYTSFASTAGSNPSGEVFCFDTATGRVVWQYSLSSYTWSSPIALYTDSGKGYLLFFDHKGTASLLDGKTGALVGSFSLSEKVEASPCAFGDIIVIGTRDKHIFGIRVS